MISVAGLFETHLIVDDLQRSIDFYGDVLMFPLARRFDDRRCAFFWVGPNRDSMLGLWEGGDGPQRIQLHTAFRVDLADLFNVCNQLTERGIVPLGFSGYPICEPTVLCWMPAAAVYFHDPDRNLLEFIAMLPDAPRPELGNLTWSVWQQHIDNETESVPGASPSGG